MNIQEFYRVLAKNQDQPLQIMLPNGEFVPEHFHVTEIGKVTKQFIDCGGTKREAVACVLQVWVAKDYDHRLQSTKLEKILKLAEPMLGPPWDMPVEIEYGSEYISQYPLGDVEVTPKGLLFVLGAKKTACLAPDKCGVSMEEKKSGYLDRQFTITGISDEFMEGLVKAGIARRIYPQMIDCTGIENERQVDTDGIQTRKR